LTNTHNIVTIKQMDLTSAVQAYAHVGGVLADIGKEIVESGRFWHEFDNAEAQAVLRHIATTSDNKEEIRERLEKLGCTVFSVFPLEALSKHPATKKPCLALGGVTMTNGILVTIMVQEPHSEGVLTI
jgi:hypothetical protein